MPINFKDINLFTNHEGDNVTYEDILKDIYNNSEESRETMRVLVEQLSSLVTSPKDAIALMEHINGLLDARIKNDDLLVKLATIVGRMIQKEMSESSTDDGAFGLSEEERQQLLETAKKTKDKIQDIQGNLIDKPRDDE